MGKMNGAERHRKPLLGALREKGELILGTMKLLASGRFVELLRDERGGPLVEFAVVLPVTLAVLMGTASFSLFLYSDQQLEFVVGGTLQQVSGEQGLTSDPCAMVQSTVTTALPKWTAGNFTYTVVITDSSGTAHTYGPTAGTSTFSCTAGAPLMADGEPISLTVTYKYAWMPILSFSPSGNLSGTETAITE